MNNAIVITYNGTTPLSETLTEIAKLLKEYSNNDQIVINTLYGEELAKAIIARVCDKANNDEVTKDGDSAIIVIGTMFESQLKLFNTDKSLFFMNCCHAIHRMCDKTDDRSKAFMHALKIICNPGSVYTQEVANRYNFTPEVFEAIRSICESFKI